MPNVHGVEFNANQSELVKEIVRELLKDGDCAVYAVPHIKPHGELRMASTPPIPGPRRQKNVFLRIRPGVNEATIVRPMNATAGDPLTKLNKFSRNELLEVIRVWRQQTMSNSREENALPKALSDSYPSEEAMEHMVCAFLGKVCATAVGKLP